MARGQLNRDLRAAAKQGDTNRVTMLINSGADVHDFDAYGRTALTLAAARGHMGTVTELILEHNADVNFAEGPCWTALMYAAEKGQEDIVSVLIDHGAEVEAHSGDCGSTALMIAVNAGHMRTASKLLSEGANVNTANNHDGSSALIQAAKAGYTDRVHWLIERQANIEALGNDGRTSLMHASENGNIDVVCALLNAGANMDAITDARGYGLTLLEGHDGVLAARQQEGVRGEEDLPPEHKNDGMTALMYASQNGHVDVVRSLLDRGARVNAITQGSQGIGLTALMLAAREGDAETVKALLDGGANVHEEDEGEWTALTYAAREGNAETVKALLDGGADIHAEDEEGNTALIWAAIHGNTEVCKILIDNGANIEARDEEIGSTPLMSAAREGHTDTVVALVKKGADVEGKDAENGLTPLMFAAREGHTDTVVALVENGADVFATLNHDDDDDDDCTNMILAYHEAASVGHTNTVTTLIDIMNDKFDDEEDEEDFAMFLDFILNTGTVVAESEGHNDTSAAIKDSAVLPRSRSNEGSSSISNSDNSADFSNLIRGRLLGSGSFGKVHLATWNSKEVAVKTLRADKWNEASQKTFETEIITLLGLQHDNIVKFLGTLNHSSELGPCIIMEYCSRGSLRNVLNRAKRNEEDGRELTWSRRLNMARGAAQGMLYLHHHNNSYSILHRDLRSPNLLVDQDWNVKVADFGLSKRTSHINGETSMNTIRNNIPHWLAPEVLKRGHGGMPSDVFSFGVIMWELLTWMEPWDTEEYHSVFAKITNNERLPVPKVEDLPGPDNQRFQHIVEDYIKLMNQCWSQQPKDRPNFIHIIKILLELEKAVRVISASVDGGEDASDVMGPTDQPVDDVTLPLSDRTDRTDERPPKKPRITARSVDCSPDDSYPNEHAIAGRSTSLLPSREIARLTALTTMTTSSNLTAQLYVMKLPMDSIMAPPVKLERAHSAMIAKHFLCNADGKGFSWSAESIVAYKAKVIPATHLHIYIGTRGRGWHHPVMDQHCLH
eukprot:jgi/Picre1/30597/NNA_005958.t1